MNYFDQIIHCQACGKAWVRRDWPNVPSTGKPKKTCCAKAGRRKGAVIDNRQNKEKYRCAACGKTKGKQDFYTVKGKFEHRCRDCKKKSVREAQAKNG